MYKNIKLSHRIIVQAQDGGGRSGGVLQISRWLIVGFMTQQCPASRAQNEAEVVSS